MMVNVRIYVSFDEQNFFWVVYNRYDRKLIMNPTKDDLKGTKLKKYNPTNICPICREEWRRGEIHELTEKNILYPYNVRYNINKEGRDTDERICSRHWHRNYQRYNPSSDNNIRKQMRDRRIGNLNDPDSTFGDNCEELTAKLFGVKRLSVEYDNYELSLDHTPIPKETLVEIGGELVDLSGQLPQTKGRHYDSNYGGWSFTNLEREWYKDFDIEVLWCVSDDDSCIERGYIIIKKEIYNQETKEGITSIGIYKNPTDSYGDPKISWYEKYRITDEKLIKKASNIWKELQ